MLSVLRIVTGAVFLSYGTMKVLGFPASPKQMPPFSPMTQFGMAGMLELVGGTAMVLGLLVRPVAFLLAGEMAVAYFQSHFPKSFFPTVNNGTPAVLFCFIFLYFMIAGGGIWSIDAMISRSHRGPSA